MAVNKIIKCKVNGKTASIEVKPYLTVEGYDYLINEIADFVFKDGIYAPHMLNFAYKYCILAYMTNINMAPDVEGVNEFLNTTDIVDKVLEVVDSGRIYSEVVDLIEFRKNAYLKNNKADELFETVTSLLKSLEGLSTDKFKDVDIKSLFNVFKTIANKDEKKIVKGVFEAEKAKNAAKTE